MLFHGSLGNGKGWSNPYGWCWGAFAREQLITWIDEDVKGFPMGRSQIVSTNKLNFFSDLEMANHREPCKLE